MKYQTFWPRFWAGIIDGFILAPLVMLEFWIKPIQHPGLLMAWTIVSYSSYWIYSVGLHACYGQTVGKMFTQIKVLDVSEDRLPTLKQAFIRDSGYIILHSLSLIGVLIGIAFNWFVGTPPPQQGNSNGLLDFAASLWFLLEIFSMFSNSKRRAFHDLIAKTVVVRLE